MIHTAFMDTNALLDWPISQFANWPMPQLMNILLAHSTNPLPGQILPLQLGEIDKCISTERKLLMSWHLHGKFPPVYPETWSEPSNSLLKARGEGRGGGEGGGGVTLTVTYFTELCHVFHGHVKLYWVTVVASLASRSLGAQFFFLQKEGRVGILCCHPLTLHCLVLHCKHCINLYCSISV